MLLPISDDRENPHQRMTRNRFRRSSGMFFVCERATRQLDGGMVHGACNRGGIRR